MKRLLYLLAVIGALSLILRGISCATPEPVDLLPEEIVGDRAFDLPTTLATHLESPILEGNAVRLLENGREIFPPMLEAIASAQDSVHIVTFVYWSGEIAERFAEELSAAARRGVEVRVLLDAVGAQRIPDELVERMEQAGCRIAWFHPFEWHQWRRINYRTHRKILVVDGRIGFTGGVGIAAEWMGDAQDPEHWRDDHFEIRGPVVRALQGGFVENWIAATGEVLAGERYLPQLSPEGSARIVSLSTSPRNDLSPVAFSYWLLLQRAERTVDIATPYFVPDASLLEAIRATARRGIRVRLLVPGDRNDSRLVRWAALALYPELLEDGVQLFEFEPTMMHVKSVLVDQRWAFVGSANFDNRSLELNDETMLLVDDPELAEALHRSFESDLARSRRVERGEGDLARWKVWLSHLGLALREQL